MTAPNVAVLSSLDPVLRDSAAGGLLCDRPGAVVLRYDLHPDGMHRLVYGADGVHEDDRRPLEHVCMSCALREDVVPTLERLLASPARTAVVLALPVASEPLPVVRALLDLPSRSPGSPVRVGPSVTVLDGDRLVEDLFGDDLLAERGLGFTADDGRAVGEVLAHQVELADCTLLPDPAGDVAGALLEHLAPSGCTHAPLHGTDLSSLLEAPALRRPERAHELRLRGDPLRLPRVVAEDRAGVSTVELQSWRPMHPARLLDRLEALGAGPVRGRGVLWLPTRPDVVVAWDGAGGQLSIGDIGSWTVTLPGPAPRRRETRLLLTGPDLQRDTLREAFQATLLTDSELAHGLDRWAGRTDGLDAWLGPAREVA